MKKVLLVFVLVFMSVMVFQLNVLSTGCETNPQFCLGDPGGDGTAVPDNYLVNTGLSAAVLDSNGYGAQIYHLYVRANDIVADLSTSDLFFKPTNGLNVFFTDEFINGRFTDIILLASGGNYTLDIGINHTYFEQNSQFVGVDATGYTVLYQANWGGSLKFKSTQTEDWEFAYYNQPANSFILAEANGMSGYFGKYLYVKGIPGTTNYQNSNILSWDPINTIGAEVVYVRTKYTSSANFQINTNVSELLYKVIVINK